MKTKTFPILLIVLFILSVAIGINLENASAEGQSSQRVYDEALSVYLSNLEREAAGKPPIRWNYELSESARWFTKDSTEVQPDGYCDHLDSENNYPDARAENFGYGGAAGAENVICGYADPDYAITAWVNSAGHRENLLNTNFREVGMGFYLNEETGDGYVAQDFGCDPAYPPVVIENEALSTLDNQVDLYVYDREERGGILDYSHAVEMRISNDVCMSDAVWQPYSEKILNWSLSGENGWKEVYVETRDALNRTLKVSDSIYYGDDLNIDDLYRAQTPPISNKVTLKNLNQSFWTKMQFSLGWVVDNSYSTFSLLWGKGNVVQDGLADGGTAYQLGNDPGESFAWVWTTEHYKNTPQVAYLRVKTSSVNTNEVVGRFEIAGGSQTFGPLEIRGTDFSTAGVYQEFALPFEYIPTSGNEFLIFKFWASPNKSITIDSIRLFSAPVPIADEYTWQIPGGNYRGQGVWIRYVDNNGNFSEINTQELTGLSMSADKVSLQAVIDLSSNPAVIQKEIEVTTEGCTPITWEAVSDQPWILLEKDGNEILVVINLSGYQSGVHTGEITISADQGESVITIPVSVNVFEKAEKVYLPVLVSP